MQNLKQLVANIDDPEILQRYHAQDPILVTQLKSIASYFNLLSQEIAIASEEPFIKAKPRSILSDASNKGILPMAVACQHEIEIFNQGEHTVTLSQGRKIEDNSGGRVWRLLKSVTIEPMSQAVVTVEQSEYREVRYIANKSETFHRVKIDLSPDMFLTMIHVRDDAIPHAHQYELKPNWYNVNAGDYTATITTESYHDLYLEFGDSERVGRTVEQGEVFVLGITESYGFIDTSRLKDASLLDVANSDELKIGIRFKLGAVVRAGASPLSLSQLKLLSSYPALYSDNAVFLGDFDFLLRKKFIHRVHFLSVWNESIHQRHYAVTVKDMNHLQLAFVPKVASEYDSLKDEMLRTIRYADSLYDGRVRVHNVESVEAVVRIDGRLSAIHNIEQVKEQIIGLLLDKYGQYSSSRWLANGFNTQEMTLLLRQNIPAFSDRMNDFTVYVENASVKPHQWLFVSKESITIDLSRSAEVVGNAWLG